MIKIGVEGNNTISTRYPGLGKRFCFAQPRSTFTFYVCTIAFLQGYCVLRLRFTFTFYVLVTFHGVWSWSPGHGYVTHVHVVTITFTVPGPYTLGPWSWLRYIRPRLRLRSWSSLYKPNTTVPTVCGHGLLVTVTLRTFMWLRLRSRFLVRTPWVPGPGYVTYVHGYGYVRGHHSTNLTRRYFDIIYVIKRYLL